MCKHCSGWANQALAPGPCGSVFILQKRYGHVRLSPNHCVNSRILETRGLWRVWLQSPAVHYRRVPRRKGAVEQHLVGDFSTGANSGWAHPQMRKPNSTIVNPPRLIRSRSPLYNGTVRVSTSGSGGSWNSDEGDSGRQPVVDPWRSCLPTEASVPVDGAERALRRRQGGVEATRSCLRLSWPWDKTAVSGYSIFSRTSLEDHDRPCVIAVGALLSCFELCVEKYFSTAVIRGQVKL